MQTPTIPMDTMLGESVGSMLSAVLPVCFALLLPALFLFFVWLTTDFDDGIPDDLRDAFYGDGSSTCITGDDAGHGGDCGD